MPTPQLYHHRRALDERAMAANSATRVAQIVHVELARLHGVESDLLAGGIAQSGPERR